MAFDGLLMRDTLADTGTVPSPGYPYSSPDVIAHAQVASPKTFFAANYTSNPNQPVQTGSQVNFIYVRTKNLATSAKAGWYISVYRAQSSFFMTPSIWKHNRLTTQSGANAVSLDTLNPGQIGVGNDHFVLSGLSSHDFCLIGVASQGPNPTIPDSFDDYAAYIHWVRTNQNVCGNNLTVRSDFATRQWERLDNFANPENEQVLVAFKTTASAEVPAGTTFGVVSAPLGVDKSQNVNTSRQLASSGFAPAKFSGTVTTFGSLPSGVTEWAGTIQTEVFVGQSQDSLVARYAVDLEEHGFTRETVPDLDPENGILVLLGSTGTEFIA